MSPSDPPIRISEPSVSRYAFATHCCACRPPPRSCSIAGSATLTTVPSMVAIPEPRIAATSVIRCVPSCSAPLMAKEATPCLRDRCTPKVVSARAALENRQRASASILPPSVNFLPTWCSVPRRPRGNRRAVRRSGRSRMTMIQRTFATAAEVVPSAYPVRHEEPDDDPGRDCGDREEHARSLIRARLARSAADGSPYSQSMCGVCGVVMTQSRCVEEATLRAMCRTISHRGPDDEGVFLDGSVGLGIRRLSIIDPDGRTTSRFETKTGPSCSSSTARSTTSRSCARSSQACGHDSRLAPTRRWSSTATRSAATTSSADCAGCLRSRSGTRAAKSCSWPCDRFGIKPLYWANVRQGLVFGSELSSASRVRPCLARSRPAVARRIPRTGVRACRREASSPASANCALQRI